MYSQIRTSFWFSIFTLCFCLNAVAQVADEPVTDPPSSAYIYESIDVPGVEFLELAASSDFEGYAGNTLSADGQKEIGFTLIDGIFTTYDFHGSQKTHFYALGNDGTAAGHYQDSEGLYHGIILEDGELRQYDFPGAVQTMIYGISDATGALSGNIIDEFDVTRGFSGDMQIEFPGATATYADFINAAGVVVGSYRDAEGIPHGFMRSPDGNFSTIDVPQMPNLEFIFVNAINDRGVVVFRAKAAGDIQRSYIVLPGGEPDELRFPGSVNTVVRNINQDGSIIGYYDTPDARRHGFIGRPATFVEAENFGNAYAIHLAKGLNMVSAPLKSPTLMTARSLAAMTGATTVIMLDSPSQQFVAWTPTAPDAGFPIEGAQGYIVNVPQPREVIFTGAKWTNQMHALASPSGFSHQLWAFVVSGYLEGSSPFKDYHITIRNIRTNTLTETRSRGNYFAAATVDLNYRGIIELGDTLQLTVTDIQGNIVAEPFNFTVNPLNLETAVLNVTLDNIGTPKQSLLLQNYPNPFNPETWIPYHLSEAGPASLSIYDTNGTLVRTLSLGYQAAGFYQSQGRAAYWNGRNALGESVASGVYFYQLVTPSFQQTQRMLILK